MKEQVVSEQLTHRVNVACPTAAIMADTLIHPQYSNSRKCDLCIEEVVKWRRNTQKRHFLSSISEETFTKMDVSNCGYQKESRLLSKVDMPPSWANDPKIQIGRLIFMQRGDQTILCI
jgi:hypothetical protein